MDALHSFEIIRPRTVEEALAARQAHPESRMIGGGTDLLVNIRRRIETPPVLIDTNDLADLKSIEVSGKRPRHRRVGAPLRGRRTS